MSRLHAEVKGLKELRSLDIVTELRSGSQVSGSEVGGKDLG